MNNLRDEIEKNKFQNINEYTHSHTIGYNHAIDDVLSILDQYNIITAPKSIKLSEIVKRLENNKIANKSKISICREGTEISIWEDYEISNSEEKISGTTFKLSISKNKIDAIGRYLINDFKWLYTLWIAGTEIIIDLECDE